MCDLTTALMVGSTVVGAIGAKKQGDAQAAQARIEAQVARENAELVDLKVKDAIYRGARSERDVRRAGDQAIGSQRAATGANNLDLNFGSPLDMVYETMRLVGEDTETVKRNTASEVADLGQEKKNYLAQAQGASAAATSYRAAGTMNAFGTVLSGGAEIGKLNASRALIM